MLIAILLQTMTAAHAGMREQVGSVLIYPVLSALALALIGWLKSWSDGQKRRHEAAARKEEAEAALAEARAASALAALAVAEASRQRRANDAVILGVEMATRSFRCGACENLSERCADCAAQVRRTKDTIKAVAAEEPDIDRCLGEAVDRVTKNGYGGTT